MTSPSKMGESEKYAMNKYLKDLERTITLSQSFLRTFVDKNILKIDDKTTILKQTKPYDQVKKFIFSIRNTPGSFRVLVDVLKKDRNTRYIAMNLEDARKARERFLAEQRKKKQERQVQKAQDTLMYEIGSRLAVLVEGRKLRGLEAHPFEYHVTECSRLIDKLEEARKELEYEDAPREIMSFPQLVERKFKRIQKRNKDEQRKFVELHKSLRDAEQELQENKDVVATLQEALVKEKENMKLWQQRQSEDSKYYCDRLVQKTKDEIIKKHAREKMNLQDQLIREREKQSTELQKLREEYKQFKESCTCSSISTKDFGMQANPGIDSECNTAMNTSRSMSVPDSRTDQSNSCLTVANVFNHSLVTDGGYTSRMAQEPNPYTKEDREFTQVSSSTKFSSEVSSLHVEETRGDRSTNLIINKVKNLHLYQN